MAAANFLGREVSSWAVVVPIVWLGVSSRFPRWFAKAVVCDGDSGWPQVSLRLSILQFLPLLLHFYLLLLPPPPLPPPNFCYLYSTKQTQKSFFWIIMEYQNILFMCNPIFIKHVSLITLRLAIRTIITVFLYTKWSHTVAKLQNTKNTNGAVNFTKWKSSTNWPQWPWLNRQQY